MLCSYCKENQAIRTYEKIKNGNRETSYYCMDCYRQLFLCVDEAEGGESLSACPYCGATAKEVVSKKLVGCGYCYVTLQKALLPVIVKMQGVETHQGKCPPPELSEDGKEEEDVITVKCKRQCRELEYIIEKLKSEGNYEGAEGYATKLSRMKSKSAIEEDFVWRNK